MAEVADAVDGTVRPPDAGDVWVRGVTVDSRTAAPGDLFVALSGDRGDGHAFVSRALAAGAAAAMVRTGSGGPGPAVEVADPGRALLRLAAHARSELTATVVGITGSTGKTCTKDLAAAVLGRGLRVVASPASFNNEVGLPLTVLSASDDTQALVCEMGSRGPGHIRLLCEVARPSVGVLTNVGVAHMELFGSAEALRDAKAELPESLPPGGVAVLNADDPVVAGYARRTPARVVWYGTGDGADVRASRIEVDPRTGRASFRLVLPDGSVDVRLPAPGAHLVHDALAAAAAATAIGVGPEVVADGLAGASLSPGRMEVVETPDGLRLINDAYNANPTSMAAALRSARGMAGRGRCIAVLGPMAELGPISAGEHERVGELLARLGIAVLVTVGADARVIAVGAEREGVEPERIIAGDDVDGAVAAVRAVAAPGDVVLVKGSRVARLERVADALAAGLPAGTGAGRRGSP